ncbi:MAG: ABC transporter permease subunit [Desulfurococcaceae archaeon]|nr:ABC transporter permease subunit [Desulfurococcaceae archaeon]
MVPFKLILELILSTLLSLGRMFTAYVLSLIIAVVTGVAMAKNKYIESILLPILDILQSIPILGFFPAVLAIFITILGPVTGGEISSIFLIVTSQVWNMIFGVYSSIKSLDPSIDQLISVYKLPLIYRLLYIYIPASRSSLAANSIISWAGGWFFLTSAEVISMGRIEYRLKGLGSFIISAFENRDTVAYTIGLLTLFTIILVSYLIIWNPFTMRYTGVKTLLGFMRIYGVIEKAFARIWSLIIEKLIMAYSVIRGKIIVIQLYFLIPLILLYLYHTKLTLMTNNLYSEITKYGVEFLWALPLTLIRVYSTVIVGLVLSILLAYISHTRFKLGVLIVMLGEILSSIPAMMWWPILLPILRGFPYGVMMFVYLQGSLWYTFFNILLFGVSSLKENILELSKIYGIRGRYYLLRVFIPSLLPSILAGGLSASGGAWNASIAAEYFQVGGFIVDMGGVGSLLYKQTLAGDILGVLLTSFLMSLVIIFINKTVWARVLKKISGYYVIE